MPGTSDQIIDAIRNQQIRDRLTALRPTGVTEGQVTDRMQEIVSTQLGTPEQPHSIAIGLRSALAAQVTARGMAGLDAGAHTEYVTDEQIQKALAAVFPPAPAGS